MATGRGPPRKKREKNEKKNVRDIPFVSIDVGILVSLNLGSG
jgi:hypothetical protein